MTAAENGHHGVCDYLITSGADVTLLDEHGMLMFLISAPVLGVYYFLSLTLSVCPSVCLFVTNIASSFLFLDGIEPFFGHQFFMTKTTKLFSSIFDLGPLTLKIYSPKCASVGH